MKVAMVFPTRESEKAISSYSIYLVESLRKKGIEVDELTYKAGSYKSFLKIFPKFKNYDIVHIQHEYNLLGGYGVPFFLAYLKLKHLKKQKIVTTMHTVLSQNEKFKEGMKKTVLRKLLYKIQNRWINWTSRKVIVHAKSFKNILVKEYSIPSEKIIVFPHSIREDIQTISKAKAKKELNLSGKIYLLIGTMVPDHGHDIIIKQADKIGKTILVVTNPSTVNDRNKNKIKNFLELNKKIIKDNNFDKFVRFDLGFIPSETWWKYFSAADLVLLPYRGGIGSGIFADAMAMKKPVIASGKYFNELAKDYGCLKLVKNDEDFPKIIKDAIKPKNYKEMLKECGRYSNENGLTPISKKYKKLYKSLLK